MMYQPAPPHWGSVGGRPATSIHAGGSSFGAVSATSVPLPSNSGYLLSGSPSHGVQMATPQPNMHGAFLQSSGRQYPGQLTPSPGPHHYSASAAGHTIGKDLECQDQQCVEEECDPDECGDDNRPPRDDNYVCGIDRRPLLPLMLVCSTVLGWVCMATLQARLFQDMTGGGLVLQVFLAVVYTVTLGTMAYVATCDPGQMKRADTPGRQQGVDEELALPRRAHKTWLYNMPIRRYDHYCRWVANSTGLLNHREFVVMLIGLVVLGVLGSVLDAVLILKVTHEGDNVWVLDIVLVLHLAYSIGLTALAYPILRLHIGFVSRNELAHEWKHNEFYVVHSTRMETTVPVNELSGDEFNDRFDSFQYDSSRNAFDKGVAANCWSFWCVRRWTPSQMGDF